MTLAPPWALRNRGLVNHLLIKALGNPERIEVQSAGALSDPCGQSYGEQPERLTFHV